MVKKENNATMNTRQPRNPSREDHTPSYLNVRTQDTERSGKPSRKRRILSYLNDFVLN